MSTVVISPVLIKDTSSTNPQVVVTPPLTIGVSTSVTVV
jgi:hypothetical protein